MTFRGIKVYYTTVHTALSKSKLPDLDYALNPYLGCGHGCVYCYARLYTKDRRASENWGFVVVLKTNIVNVLSREVKKL
ncbi:MAG: radical SAM protein, partial [Desulfurococcaceae archaeon]